MALDLIQKIKIQYFSDSSSALTSLQSKKLDNPLIIKLLCKLEKISDDDEILLCLIPSYTGTNGNEQIGKAA